MIQKRVFFPFLLVSFLLFPSFSFQDQKERPPASEKYRALFSKLRDTEKLEEKVQLIEAFLKEVPKGMEHQMVKFRLGWEYFMAEQYLSAARVFREVAQGAEDPEQVGRALHYLGVSLFNLGELPEARKIFEDVVERFPNAPEAPLAEGFVHEIEHLQIGMVPPPIKGPDMEGKSLSLRDYRGKVTLINFWALSSLPSLKEFEHLMMVYQKYNRAGFDILGVSMDTDMEKLKEFLEKEKIPWRIVCDGMGWKSKYALLYNVQYRFPLNILLDRGGVIRYKGIRGRDLEEAVKILIGQK